jgi:hypothetical protein
MVIERVARVMRKMKYNVTAMYQWSEKVLTGEKTIPRQKVAHANASMTFDKSQYERAETERG